MSTKQLDLWTSQFGLDYAARNQITDEGLRRLMRSWGRMLTHAITPSPSSVLEVGCNLGRNLVALSRMVPKVYAVEPNAQVAAAAQENPLLSGADIRTGSAFALPFDDATIDLVFTAGVLIHIDPVDLPRAVDEIVRVARHYVLCVEYFAHEPVAVTYRGRDGFLFKRDFGRFYLDRFPSMRVLDYGFLWKPVDSGDNSNWWLFEKRSA
jgi:pseudaminic acid biosynthesis-associated methylase